MKLKIHFYLFLYKKVYVIYSKDLSPVNYSLYMSYSEALNLFVKGLDHKATWQRRCQQTLPNGFALPSFLLARTAFFVVHMQVYYYVTRNDAVCASRVEGSCVRRSPHDSQARGAEES